MNKLLDDFVNKNRFTNTGEFLCELQRLAADNGLKLPDLELENKLPRTGSPENSADLVEPNRIELDPSQSLSTLALQYNYALVLYYQRQYLQAERILANCLNDKSNSSEKRMVFTDFSLTESSLNLVPCSDLTLCRRILLLWLEVLLHLRQSERVFLLCGACLVALSSALFRSMNNSNPSSSEPNTDASQNRVRVMCEMLETIHRPIQLFYVRACLLTGRIKAAEGEIKLIETSGNQTASDNSGIHQPIEQKGTSPGVSKDTSEVHWNTGHCLRFLQAQLAYLKNQYSNALRRLSDMPPSAKSPMESGHCESILVWNNLSVVHHRSGQFHLSGLQLRRALRETDKTIRDSLPKHLSSMVNDSQGKSLTHLLSGDQVLLNQIPLHVFTLSQHHELLYNLGLQLLFARKPAAAFSTLSQLVTFYPRNPRLWYRLAECCIKVHCPNNLGWWQLETRSSCALETVGIGPCRNLILSNGVLESPKPWIEAASMCSPTLEFGSFCLRNAMHLLPRPPAELLSNNDADKCNQQTKILDWAESQSVSVLPSSSPLRGLGLLHLMTAIHLGTAYIALCLNNPVDVLSSAGGLLEDHIFNTSESFEMNNHDGLSQAGSNGYQLIQLTSFAPPAYRFLARLYMAEALVALDRISDATTCLRFRLSDSIFCESQVSTAYSSSISLGTECLKPCSNLADPDKQTQLMDGCMSNGTQHSQCATPGALCIYSPDFPRTGAQATGLLLYNLAATLAIDKQWTMAEHILLLSLPGLSIPVEELNGRRWTSSQSPSDILCSPVQPLPAILLRVYLTLGLNKSDQTLALLREHFGHLTLAGRLHGPFAVPRKPVNPEPSLPDKSRGWTMSDLRQLLKASMNSGMSQIASGARVPMQSSQCNVQRPNNLWAPAQHYKQSLGLQTPQTPNYAPSLIPNQATSSQFHASYGGRWEQQPTSNQTYTTGLITAANESDWPPL